MVVNVGYDKRNMMRIELSDKNFTRWIWHVGT